MFSSNTSAVSGDANYIEDVFSTYLYAGDGNNRTITNNIDTSTKGGLVWIKDRSSASYGHMLYDTARGASNGFLHTNTTEAAYGSTYGLTAFGTSGFNLDGNSEVNLDSSQNYVSWTFRKQPKFFDVVTYTGTGSAQNIAHSLGSVPGAIIIKRTDSTANWGVYHRSLQTTPGLENKGIVYLNLTNSVAYGTSPWNATAPTSTQFTVGYAAETNASGATYVAYVFAHDAGGFGLTGTDNVISCGTFTTNSSGLFSPQTLGYEPQWLMVKRVDSTGPWWQIDTSRGMALTYQSYFRLNDTVAESALSSSYTYPTATGFAGDAAAFGASGTFIYIAIRRGPMKVPTDATKLYTEVTRTSTAPAWTSGFPVDWFFQRTTGADNWAVLSRLTGSDQLRFNTTDAATTATEFKFDFMNGVNGSLYNDSTDHGWMMRRAPNFFDEVCYTGTGSATTVTHNLGAVPELIIVKSRSSTGSFWTYSNAIGNTKYLRINDPGAPGTNTGIWNSTDPTSSVFTVGSYAGVNSSGTTYVSYLFATCPGVSKVGSYTGNGSTQTINCGFAGGARFVLIKRTDDVGDWYVYDTARGMTTLVDPYLLMNSTAAESATLGSVTTVSTGFAVNASILAAINTNTATYIYLAIA